MKKKYTKKQITEAINFWTTKLFQLNESKMTKQQYDDFQDKLKNGTVTFRFIKKDGSERKAIGTLNVSLMPSQSEQRRIYSNKQDQFGNNVNYDDLVKKLEERSAYMPYFWDLEKNEYRQFHVSRFIAIDSFKPALKNKYQVVTMWYVPEMRNEIVEASNPDEVDDILEEKYSHYMSSHSESQDLYNGVYSVKKIS